MPVAPRTASRPVACCAALLQVGQDRPLGGHYSSSFLTRAEAAESSVG